MHISEREYELPEDFIERLLKIAVENKSIISLGPGEPDFPLPIPLVKHLKSIANKCNHYSPPKGRIELREALVRKLKKDNKIHTSPENIVVTNGSQEALFTTAAAILDVSEQIIVPNPGFVGYVPAFELLDAFPVQLQLKEENNFELDPDDVKKIIDKKKTKAILINTPSNPTGNVIRKKVLEELADIAINYNLFILSDEAYEKIIYDDAKHVSIGSFNGMEDHVITLQTFSKSYAMCGFRLGYCVAPEKIANAISKEHVFTSICAPTVSQLVGLKALSLPEKYTKEMVKEYDRRRKLIVPRLNDMGLKTIKPKGAFYTFSNIQEYTKNSKKFATDLLNNAKVAVVPGIGFGSHGEGFIRCSFATDYNLIEKALDKMEAFLKNEKR